MMQLELQNIWRPLAAVLLFGWLLVLGLTASQDLNNLRVAPQRSNYAAQPPATNNGTKPDTISYSSIADMFLMGTVEWAVPPITEKK